MNHAKASHKRLGILFFILALMLTLLVACDDDKKQSGSPSTAPSADQSPNVTDGGSTEPNGNADGDSTPTPGALPSSPASVAFLVNKEYALPDDYVPTDLVYPDVHFIFAEKIEKKMMREEAAKALEKLFAAAKADGVYLGGVSAYRSHATQTSLFNRYVEKDGLEKAKTYSAVPGHSEHETGLSIDVSDSAGNCAADPCFAGTKEANWLEQHAADYGYIIRYPEGKEAITGYVYEAWHIRYVGVEIAQEIAKEGITLEQYYGLFPR